MKILMRIVGALLLLAGGVWVLQGLNVLPGSFMTGQTKWAAYGAMAMITGIALLLAANRRPGTPP